MLKELFNSTSEITLPPDTQQWGDIAITKLTAKYPGLRGKIERFECPKIDESTGTALGYILLSNKYRIPIVINRYKMSPLDLYTDKKTMLPLNERTIKFLEQGSWPFKSVPKKDRAQLFKTARTYSQDFLDKHHDTLLKIAMLHPELLEGVGPHETYDGGVRTITVNSQNALPVTITTFEKEASCTIPEFAHTYGPEILKMAMRRGYVILSDLPPFTRLENVSAPAPSYKPNKNWGHFVSRGTEYRGEAFQLHDNSPVTLTTDGYYDMGVNNFYIKVLGESRPDISGFTPGIGDDFFIKHGDLVSGPYTLKSVDRIGNQLSYLAIRDGLDGNVVIKPVEGLKKMQIIDNTILIPDYYQILGMRKIGRERNTPDMEVTASTNIVVRYSPTGVYDVDEKGVTGLDKHMLTGTSKVKALMVLTKTGLNTMDAEKIVQQAQATGSANFAYTGRPGRQEKTASAEDVELAAEIAKIAEDANLLKTALDISELDPTSVDQALEIHAVTPATIRKMCLLSGDFAKTLERLCQILFLKRLNRKEIKIEESQLLDAINALDMIITKLNILAA